MTICSWTFAGRRLLWRATPYDIGILPTLSGCIRARDPGSRLAYSPLFSLQRRCCLEGFSIQYWPERKRSRSVRGQLSCGQSGKLPNWSGRPPSPQFRATYQGREDVVHVGGNFSCASDVECFNENLPHAQRGGMGHEVIGLDTVTRTRSHALCRDGLGCCGLWRQPPIQPRRAEVNDRHRAPLKYDEQRKFACDSTFS